MRTVAVLAVMAVSGVAIVLVHGCGGMPAQGLAVRDEAAASDSVDLIRRIVVFEKGYTNEAAEKALVRRFGEDLRRLELINGMAVLLPGKAVGALARERGVLRIDIDAEVYALGQPAVEARRKPTPPPAQKIPWGVDRIDAEYAWPASTGVGVKVAVIHTGIDKDHPDLVANIAGGCQLCTVPP